MWIRTLQALQAGTELIPANSRIQVDDHIGRILVRRKKAETIIVSEADMAAVLTPDRAQETPAPKSVEK